MTTPPWWREKVVVYYYPPFLKRTEVLAPHLIIVFRRHVSLGNFPGCWRQSNVTLIPKWSPSFFVANNRPISITSVLLRFSNVLCRFIWDDLWNAVVCFQPPSLLIGKVWAPVMLFRACNRHVTAYNYCKRESYRIRTGPCSFVRDE